MEVGSSPPSKSDTHSDGGDSVRSTFGNGLDTDMNVEDFNAKVRRSFTSVDVSAIRDTMTEDMPRLVSSFFQASQQLSFQISDDEPNAMLRRRIHSALKSKWNNLLTVLIVLVDFSLSCADTDLRATGQETPLWMEMVVYVCLVLYSTDFCLRIFVERSQLWKEKWWTLLDTIICLMGLTEVALKLMQIELSRAGGSVRLLRLARALRMMRLLRGVAYVKELKKLVQMTVNCFRTLLWSFLFCFGVMTLWSLVAVEIVHPMVQELDKVGQWDDCSDCLEAFNTIFHSNITLFTTIVAGDGWGKLAVPLMKAYPGSSIFFVGSSLSLVYGILNLVVAVVVDTFAEQRAKDERELAFELEEDCARDKKEWTKVFEAMDTDASGTVSLDELTEAASNSNDFRDRLRILDIDTSDLRQLFNMLDSDGSGDIEPAEFIDALVRWKHESKSASRFVKYNMERSLRNEEELLKLQDLLANRCRGIEKNLKTLSEEVGMFISGRAVSRQQSATSTRQESHPESQCGSFTSVCKTPERLDSLGDRETVASIRDRCHTPQSLALPVTVDCSLGRSPPLDESDVNVRV